MEACSLERATFRWQSLFSGADMLLRLSGEGWTGLLVGCKQGVFSALALRHVSESVGALSAGLSTGGSTVRERIAEESEGVELRAPAGIM